MPKPGFSTAVMVATAFLLSAAHVPTARSEPAFCLKRVNAYVRELDPILDEAKYSLTPINELNDRYFPFVDCDPGALIEGVTHSRFFRRAAYDKGGEQYGIVFSSDDVVVVFFYRIDERVSFSPAAGWVHK